jgi:hypothetical protein
MARPRREEDYTALYVRIPSAEAEKLHRAADFLRTPKRELITRLVADFDPDDPVWTKSRRAFSRRAGGVLPGAAFIPPRGGARDPHSGATRGAAAGR